MTKAVRVHAFGSPDVLHYEEAPVGKPGPGQVLLRQHAVGLNYIDVYMRNGAYASRIPSLPFIPGSEAAGEIVAIGADVDGLAVGDRVAYGTALGAYAEIRVIDAAKLVPLPANLSYETGAAMMLKGLTAQYLVRQTFRVAADHTVLVHAAAGATGLIVCQWAKALGAKVIGTVGSEAKAKLAREAGADHVILYRSEDFPARVKAITKGALCDAVYDGVGKDTFPASLDCLKPRGLFVSFGSASGAVAGFELGLLATKGSLYATRPTLFDYAADAVSLRAMALDLFDAVETGAVTIPIHARVPLADAAKAHRALEARETTGATVLLP